MNRDSPIGPLQLAIIQSSPFCNINCRYCYLPERSAKHRLQTPTLELICRAIFSSKYLGRELSVVWHAGEPTAVPIEFYDNSFKTFERFNAGTMHLRHCFQTNGTLLTDDWCSFFAENGVSVGVSIDGPSDIHDANRRDRLGRGTHERSMRGVDNLRRHGVPFHVIAVLSAASLRRAGDILDFFCDQGIFDVAFNVEEAEGVNRQSSLSADSARHVEQFFLDVLQRQRSVPELRVRETDTLLARLRRTTTHVRSAENTPLALVTFDARGNVSTFSPELCGMKHARFPSLCFGNVANLSSVDDILDTELFRQVFQEIRHGIAACSRTCGHFSICGGGAPSNKLCELGTFAASETDYCRLRVKALARAVSQHVEGMD